MTENKIRIVRKEDELYKINISDDGKEIVLDLTDIGLPLKINKAFNKVNANVKTLQSKIQVIENKKDNNVSAGLMTVRERDITQAMLDSFRENRKILDEIFGEGTMQTLFGDSNYLGMYEDLFDLLEPHFEKASLNVEGIKKRIMTKYAKTEDDVLS